MRRLRLPRCAAVVMAALAVVLVVPQAGHAASASGAQHAGPAVTATTVADVTTSGGGLCSVPGIGDIGGLLGFCALGSSGLTGDLNNICQPSLPTPEPADGGIDSMIEPPASGKQPATLYDEYGVAGDYWAATNLQCSDMTSLIGNNVAGMVFDAAKSLDRVTITVYESAAGEGILGWLPRQRDLLPLPRGRGHPGRDLAGLARADPQARDPDDRGHDLDDRGLRSCAVPDRQACRSHRARPKCVGRHLAGTQRGLREVAKSGSE
jgi:hypothetical protein